MAGTPLKILMVSAEVAPFAKTGGPADVVGALPKALREQEHDIRIIMPRYGRIRRDLFAMNPVVEPFPVLLRDRQVMVEILGTNLPSHNGPVPVYMVENREFFDREGIYMYEDDADRFVLFCRAALETTRQLGWQPDIIHCHDWHAAIIPNWLKTTYRDDPFFQHTASVYTIHNLAYQGVFGNRVLEIAGVSPFHFLATPDAPHQQEASDFMSRGIGFADTVTTVSETYASQIIQPEYGEGLDLLLRERAAGGHLFGVLNGIDTEINNPATDPFLVHHFTAESMDGKHECKADIQRAAGLPESPRTPLLGIISRLTNQKGIDLVDQMLESLLRTTDVQLLVLGTGAQYYHDRLHELQARFPQKLRAFITFNTMLAQKIYAGADMFLMPSRFEPCGLGQMIAMRYGTIPVVRSTGGLADTVTDNDASHQQGNGFSFEKYTSDALQATIQRAISQYHQPEIWQPLMHRAMAADHSWAMSARRYTEIYEATLAGKRVNACH